MEKKRLATCLSCNNRQLVRPDRPNAQGSFTCVGCGSALLFIIPSGV